NGRLAAKRLPQAKPPPRTELSILTTPESAVRARSTAFPAPWQRELRDSIRDPQRLVEALSLPAEMAAKVAAGGDFPLFVPPSYLRRIQPGNPSDPLLLQVWPAAAEAESPAGFTDDPVEEAAFALRP